MALLRSALARRFIASVNAGVFSRVNNGLESPVQFPGNAAWYDAGDVNSMRNNAGNIPSNGEGIKLWADKSGNSSVNVLCLNGEAGNYASALDSAALSITGDIDVRWLASAVWTGATVMTLGSKNNGAGNISWNANWASNTLAVTFSSNGTATTGNTSASFSLADYELTWIRFTRVSATGAITYFKSSDGSTWTQVGTGATTAGAIYDGNAIQAIGALNGTSQFFTGNIHRAQIYNGIAGTLAFDANFATFTKLAASGTESSSNAATVTINTSGATGARISGARDLYQGTAANQPILTIAAGGNYLTFDGSNDYLKAAAFSLSQPETVYFVGSQVTWMANDRIFAGHDGASSEGALIQSGVSPAVVGFAGLIAGSNTSWSVATNAVVAVVFNFTSSLTRVNRTAAVTGSMGTSKMNGFTLAANANLGGQFANITASEVLVYSTADSTAVQDAKILYLGRHNGIAV